MKWKHIFTGQLINALMFMAETKPACSVADKFGVNCNYINKTDRHKTWQNCLHTDCPHKTYHHAI